MFEYNWFFSSFPDENTDVQNSDVTGPSLHSLLSLYQTQKPGPLTMDPMPIRVPLGNGPLNIVFRPTASASPRILLEM